MRLGEWLRAERKTQETFAEEIGMSQSYISQLIAGMKWPSRETARKIVEKTGGAVTLQDFDA